MENVQLLVPLFIPDPSLYPIIERFYDSLAENYPDLDIITSDDCSPLPLPELRGTVYLQPTNLGYTANVNFLLKKSTADKVIVCNDDVVIGKGQLDWIQKVNGLMIGSPRDTASSPDDTFGCIFGLTREVLDKIGYLDEKYKHFYSDKIFYSKAKEAGVEVVKFNDIVIDHVESATFKMLDKAVLLEEDLKRYTQA